MTHASAALAAAPAPWCGNVPLAGLDLLQAGGMLAAALGCGLLAGVERERRKGRGRQRGPAGLRTFALCSVLGCAAMLVGGMALTAVVAGFVGVLVAVAHARSRARDPGLTTELALLLTLLVGALCVWSLPLAAGLAVIQTGLLAGREPMHRFARQWLSAAELRDGLLLAALALVALPLVPDRPLWGPVLNPYVILRLVVLLLGIQALAHLAGRLMQARQAMALSALASGFVSSTATIASLGMRVRHAGAAPVASAGAALLSSVATLVQLLVMAAGANPVWLKVLWLPAGAAALVALAWGGALIRHGANPAVQQGSGEPARRAMLSLRDALAMAALLTGIQAVVYGLGQWQGDAGRLAGTMLAALFEVHAAMAALFVEGAPDGPHGAALRHAVVLGLGVHALAKCVTAALSGGWRYVLAFAPGQLAHTGVCLGLLLGQPA